MDDEPPSQSVGKAGDTYIDTRNGRMWASKHPVYGWADPPASATLRAAALAVKPGARKRLPVSEGVPFNGRISIGGCVDIMVSMGKGLKR